MLNPPPHSSTGNNSILYTLTRYSTTRCDALRCGAMRHDTVRCDTMRCDTIRYRPLTSVTIAPMHAINIALIIQSRRALASSLCFFFFFRTDKRTVYIIIIYRRFWRERQHVKQATATALRGGLAVGAHAIAEGVLFCFFFFWIIRQHDNQFTFTGRASIVFAYESHGSRTRNSENDKFRFPACAIVYTNVNAVCLYLWRCYYNTYE